uniref:Uncharacterized protein n=1 Tax=Siphoviridae sp. ctk5O4 TaxID=2827921 RepID=A0A8S5SJH7_9CAUD|nr:MAG TPA: hypothetical protein [Siphoviridae sp. ctk5O4]
MHLLFQYLGLSLNLGGTCAGRKAQVPLRTYRLPFVSK